MGILYGDEFKSGYRPSLFHCWFKPGVSGNTLNGLGEKEVRRPTPLYHRQDSWHPWRLVQEMFYLRSVFANRMLEVFKSKLLDMKKPAGINSQQVIRTPEEWTKKIKDYANSIGIDKVGITAIRPEWIFEGDSLPEKYVIILAMRMDYESMAHTIKRDFRTPLKEVLEVYYRSHVKSRKLADWLRQQGWAARGFGGPMGSALNILPAAIEAGIGELGKHGSLICKEMGALFRLAYVVTDLPIATDRFTDAGVDDFCLRCNLCAVQCPPKAISNEKQMVRGVERWYVNFDQCVPYFNENLACGLCLAVCPWSQPGSAETITRKMMRLREKRSVTA